MDQLLDMEIVDSIREVGDFRANDGFARELFDLFVEQSELAISELSAAIDRGDLQQIRYFAHRLKGSAGNIGARALSMQAEQIEQASKGGGDDEFLRRVTSELVPLRAESLKALSLLLIGQASSSLGSTQ